VERMQSGPSHETTVGERGHRRNQYQIL